MWSELPCVPAIFPTKWIVYQGRTCSAYPMDLLHRGAHEEFRFFSILNAKVPLLNDADPQDKARFLGCQHRTMAAEDGEPLLYCAIAEGVAVGFPSSQEWDGDLLTVEFEELLTDGTSEEWSEDIDNVARHQHALGVIDRHRSGLRELLMKSGNGVAIWDSREEAFPHLVFGQDVETHLSMVNPGELGTLINRLGSLDEAAAAWPLERGEVPPWKSKVTDENYSVKTNPSLREARRFRSSEGNRELFLLACPVRKRSTYSSSISPNHFCRRNRLYRKPPTSEVYLSGRRLTEYSTLGYLSSLQQPL